jgi:hypothetical protein
MTERRGANLPATNGDWSPTHKRYVDGVRSAISAVKRELGLPDIDNLTMLPLLTQDKTRLRTRTDLPFDQHTRERVLTMRETANDEVNRLVTDGKLPEAARDTATHEMIAFLFGRPEPNGK